MGATVNRLAILVTTILIAGLSIFFLQRYQVDRMDRSVLAQAAQAEKEGNFEKALPLYQEHIEVAPDDQEAKLKYADVLLKGAKNPARQEQAAQLYEQYVNRFSADKKARRRLAELTVEMGGYDKAQPHLELLLKSEPNDGALFFLLGRCQEARNERERALESFKSAVEKDAPQRPEADSRLATLLVQLNQPGEANNVIDKMVKDHPENYRVYLERGSYLRRFGRTPEQRKSAKGDLQRVREMAPNDPKVYTELALLARLSKNDDEARRVIEDGLEVLPNDPTLHLERADLEKPGSIDKAITSLRHSLELLPDDPMLRWHLANDLAQRGGDPAELLTQIGELKRLNLKPILIGFLEAKYLINCNEWKKAILSLVKLQQLVEQSEGSKAQVHDLLAQCYHHLGDRVRERVERVRERVEYERSIRANPLDVQARLGLAAILADRGEIDNAIKEYRQLLDQLQKEHPEAELAPIRGRLIQLLIARNQQLAVGQRDWPEVEKLVNIVKESAPQSSEWVILQTELLVAQDKTAEAQDLLEKARSRSPLDVKLWIKSAELLRRQRKFDDARKLLDQAQKSLGDSVALRLERARLLPVQGGADLPKALGALAEGSASFSGADRRRLLEVLAQEAARLSDRTLATDLWSQLAKLDPKDLEPRFHLFELALQGKNRADIENRLNEIKRIEEVDGSNGKYGEALYLIWQSANTTDLKEQANLRNAARSLLNDLGSRRQDWPRIPRTLAELALADLSQPDLSDDEKKEKQYDAAKLYLKAIELGLRDPDVIRRATDLLYATGRNQEAMSLWTELSTTSAAGSALLLQCSLEALRHRDLEGALELARKAKAANPNDFQVRRWLALRLIDKQLLTDAENELREAVAAVPSDPARRTALVEFLTLTKQLEKAEKAVHDAESALREKPLGPARCCEVLGRAYKTATQDDQKSKLWLDEAGRWYVAAQRAQPNDLMVTRQYFDFLFGSRRIPELESWLNTILENKEPKNAEKRALARRYKALTLLASRDAEQRRKARDVLEEISQTNEAGPEDRFTLALMYGNDGDWTKAHDTYKKLVAETDNTPDLTISNRRPEYITQFIDELLRHFQSDQSPELLNEAQDLITELKALRPDAFSVVAFEARLLKARNEMDKAIELIQSAARRPNLTDPLWLDLVNLAEELGQANLAKDLLRQRLEQPKPSNFLSALASLRERQKRFQEAEALYAQVVKQGQGNAISLSLNNLAWLKALRGVDLPEALELINKATANPGQIPVPELLDTRAVIYMKLGNAQKAIDDLNQAITLKPTAAKYFHLAQAYLQAGNKPAAVEALSKARPKGTTPDGLHPLEAPAYQQLIKDLGTQ